LASLPDLDVVRVQRWCAGWVPEHVRDQVRIEFEVAPQLTIVERRPPRRHSGPQPRRRRPVEVPGTDQLVYVGRDDRGVELHIIAVPDDRDPDGLAVMHCMPNDWRRSER
jgi:hypothetical protein